MSKLYAYEQTLNDLDGQEVQIAVMGLKLPKTKDIGIDRVDDLFYDDTEVRTIRCSTRMEAVLSFDALKACDYGVWMDTKDQAMLTLHYYIPFNSQGSLSVGEFIPERLWNAGMEVN